MKASGKRDDGYEKVRKRQPSVFANKLRRVTKTNPEEAKGLEALEAMFETINKLLAVQRRVYAGEIDMEKHVAKMRTLLRYVLRKVKETTKSTRMKQSPSRKNIRQ